MSRTQFLELTFEPDSLGLGTHTSVTMRVHNRYVNLTAGLTRMELVPGPGFPDVGGTRVLGPPDWSIRTGAATAGEARGARALILAPPWEARYIGGDGTASFELRFARVDGRVGDEAQATLYEVSRAQMRNDPSLETFSTAVSLPKLRYDGGGGTQAAASLAADSTTVRSGDKVRLRWTTKGVQAAYVTSPWSEQPWTVPASDLNRSASAEFEVQEDTTFTLVATPRDSTLPPLVQQVTVSVAEPRILEFSAEVEVVAGGVNERRVALSWRGNEAVRAMTLSGMEGEEPIGSWPGLPSVHQGGGSGGSPYVQSVLHTTSFTLTALDARGAQSASRTLLVPVREPAITDFRLDRPRGTYLPGGLALLSWRTTGAGYCDVTSSADLENPERLKAAAHLYPVPVPLGADTPQGSFKLTAYDADGNADSVDREEPCWLLQAAEPLDPVEILGDEGDLPQVRGAGVWDGRLWLLSREQHPRDAQGALTYGVRVWEWTPGSPSKWTEPHEGYRTVYWFNANDDLSGNVSSYRPGRGSAVFGDHALSLDTDYPDVYLKGTRPAIPAYSLSAGTRPTHSDSDPSPWKPIAVPDGWEKLPVFSTAVLRGKLYAVGGPIENAEWNGGFRKTPFPVDRGWSPRISGQRWTGLRVAEWDGTSWTELSTEIPVAGRQPLSWIAYPPSVTAAAGMLHVYAFHAVWSFEPTSRLWYQPQGTEGRPVSDLVMSGNWLLTEWIDGLHVSILGVEGKVVAFGRNPGGLRTQLDDQGRISPETGSAIGVYDPLLQCWRPYPRTLPWGDLQAPCLARLDDEVHGFGTVKTRWGYGQVHVPVSGLDVEASAIWAGPWKPDPRHFSLRMRDLDDLFMDDLDAGDPTSGRVRFFYGPGQEGYLGIGHCRVSARGEVRPQAPGRVGSFTAYLPAGVKLTVRGGQAGLERSWENPSDRLMVVQANAAEVRSAEGRSFAVQGFEFASLDPTARPLRPRSTERQVVWGEDPPGSS